MQAVILAAGKGTRLMPLTKDKPKCMIEVNGKPIIKHLYDTLMDIGGFEIIIVVGYKENVLRLYSLQELKESILTVQPVLNGTASAIFTANEYIDGNFIVLSGDIIYSKEEILSLMERENSLLYTKQDNRLYEYGTLDIEDNRIKHINEKSTEPTSNYVNCGAYHFTEEIFELIAETEYDERFHEQIITNSINLMIDEGIPFYGKYIDNLNEISYPDDIEKVEKRI